MGTSRNTSRFVRPTSYWIVALVVVSTAFATPVRAQDEDALRERIRTRIENDQALQAREREQLRQHLGECAQVGLSGAALQALFPEGAPLGEQIKHQNRVLAMAREGLPVEPLVDKLLEGRRKNAPDAVLDRVTAQLEQHVRSADRLLEHARGAGARAGEPQVERRLTESVARNMWRGLQDGDFERLMDQARDRLRDGGCSTTDLAAASATATDLMELGVERQRAVEIAGEALRNRYAAGDIRRLSHMAMAAHAHGRPLDETMGRMREGLHQSESMDSMFQHMAQHGWMGPGDEHGGRGGHSPVDDVIGGPGGHHGGDTGGMGGSGHGGGDDRGGGHGGGGN